MEWKGFSTNQKMRHKYDSFLFLMINKFKIQWGVP